MNLQDEMKNNPTFQAFFNNTYIADEVARIMADNDVMLSFTKTADAYDAKLTFLEDGGAEMDVRNLYDFNKEESSVPVSFCVPYLAEQLRKAMGGFDFPIDLTDSADALWFELSEWNNEAIAAEIDKYECEGRTILATYKFSDYVNIGNDLIGREAAVCLVDDNGVLKTFRTEGIEETNTEIVLPMTRSMVLDWVRRTYTEVKDSRDCWFITEDALFERFPELVKELDTNLAYLSYPVSTPVTGETLYHTEHLNAEDGKMTLKIIDEYSEGVWDIDERQLSVQEALDWVKNSKDLADKSETHKFVLTAAGKAIREFKGIVEHNDNRKATGDKTKPTNDIDR